MGFVMGQFPCLTGSKKCLTDFYFQRLILKWNRPEGYRKWEDKRCETFNPFEHRVLNWDIPINLDGLHADDSDYFVMQ
jgi:hypothetical protein